MFKKLTREELINLVNKIVECEGSEEEIDEMIDMVKKNVPYLSKKLFSTLIVCTD